MKTNLYGDSNGEGFRRKKKNSGILAAKADSMNASVDALMKAIVVMAGWPQLRDVEEARGRRAGTGTGVSGGCQLPSWATCHDTTTTIPPTRSFFESFLCS